MHPISPKTGHGRKGRGKIERARIKKGRGEGKQSSGRTLSFYIDDRRGLVWPYTKSFMGGEGWVRGLHKKYLIMGHFQLIQSTPDNSNPR